MSIGMKNRSNHNLAWLFKLSAQNTAGREGSGLELQAYFDETARRITEDPALRSDPHFKPIVDILEPLTDKQANDIHHVAWLIRDVELPPDQPSAPPANPFRLAP